MAYVSTPESPNTVPAPNALLAIQAGGGILALVPILELKGFADIDTGLYIALVCFAALNALLSIVVLAGVVGRINPVARAVQSLGELGLCRIVILYDMVLLGFLVFFTGGPEKSAFAPQAAAVLPMAMLVKDRPSMKWIYAAVFLIVYLISLNRVAWFRDYGQLPEQIATKQQWSMAFFFIFTLFPVIYSIRAEQADATR